MSESAPPLPFGLNKLSVRLLLLVLLTAVPVFAVEAYYELQVREQRRTEIGQQVQQMADLVAGQLDRMIEGAQTVLVTLGQLPAVRERDPAACNDALIRLAARFPNVDGIGVVGPDGVVVCNSIPRSPRVSVAHRPYSNAPWKPSRWWSATCCRPAQRASSWRSLSPRSMSAARSRRW